MGIKPEFFQSWIFSDEKGIWDAPAGDSILDWIPLSKVELDRDFEWLEKEPAHVEGPYEYDFEGKLPHLATKAEELRLTLPTSFFSFFQNKALLLRFRPSSHNHFAFGDALEPVADTPNLHFFPFLFDGQYSNFWYLVMNHEGEHCVATWGNLRGAGPADAAARDQTDVPPDYYAPSFREAIYRYFMEVEISHRRNVEGKPLTDAMLTFLGD